MTHLKDIESAKECDLLNGELDETEEIYVSAIVPNTDDPSIPSLSFRVIILGFIWNAFLSIANTIFSFRSQPFSIPSTVATLLSYPMGIAFARLLPKKKFNFFGYKWSLNPGPFSVKEHVLIYVIASAGGGLAYGTDNVVVQKFSKFMGNPDINYWNSLAFVMSVQLIGFGFAGLLRRFLIKPAAMIWPQILSTVALFVGFHEISVDDPLSKFKLSRYKFFWIALSIMFVYTWIPEFFVTVLQSIPLLCLLTSNKTARFLGSAGLGHGVGLGALTFDWQYLSLSGPLTTPIWASFQFLISTIIWMWMVVPALYYSNAFGSDMAIGELNSPYLYTRDAKLIEDKMSLMDTKTYELNQTAYDAVAPIRITTFFAVQYGISFMSITAAIAHVAIWNGKSIYKQLQAALRQVTDDEPDIHNRLMQAYPDVPEWMYLIFFIVTMVIQCLVSAFTPFAMPVWASIFAVGLGFVFSLPFGIIQAVTGYQLGLNVLTEFLIGLLIPGETVAVMAFKSLGYNSMIQALTLAIDLKLGHYMKINPVHMVFAQFFGTVIGAIFNNSIAVYSETLLSNMLFKPDSGWGANNYQVFYSAGVIWGAVGPMRFFGIGSVYQDLLWFFLAGALMPFLPWVGNKIYPSKFWNYVNIPLLTAGATAFQSPGNPQSIAICSFIVAWIFQYYIFNNHREWWKKYNYMLSVALDSGMGLAVFVITLVQVYTNISVPFYPGNPTDLDYYCFDKSYK